MLCMLLMGSGVDKDVVDENNHKLIQKRSEDFFHIVQEQGRSVSHTKRHNYILIVPIFGPKSCLLHIINFNSNLMVPRSHINLRKHYSIGQLIHQVIYPWQGILVLNG